MDLQWLGMHLTGLIIGVSTFIIIGVFHPIVIKAEYYIGKKIWPAFLVAGIVFVVVALFIGNLIVSILLSVIGFSCLWSINEIIEQQERVRKGWFKANPKRMPSQPASEEDSTPKE